MVNEVPYVKAAFKRENSQFSKAHHFFPPVCFVLSLLLFVYPPDQIFSIRSDTLHDSSERVDDLLCTIYYFAKFEES